MRKHNHTKPRVIRWAVLFALCLAMAAPGCFAAETEGLLVYAWWTQDGMDRQAFAVPVGQQGYEDSFWLYLPPEAMENGAILVAESSSGDYASVLPTEMPLGMLDWVDAGEALDDYITLEGLDANGSEAAQWRLFISTQSAQAPAAFTPWEPENTEEPDPREVENTQEPDPWEPENTEEPDPWEPENTEEPDPWEPENTEEADPWEVENTQAPDPGEEEGQDVQATVSVWYADPEGNVLSADAVVLAPGTHTVYADADRVPQGYTLTGEDSAVLTVDTDGTATLNPVIFVCVPVQAEAKLEVLYLDEEGSILSSEVRSLEPGVHTVRADAVPDGYLVPEDEQEQTVTVNPQGVCQPETVMFLCRATAQSAQVEVMYADLEGSVLSSFLWPVQTGENVIEALSVPEGYVLRDAAEKTVVVDGFGNCTPTSVVFACERAPREPVQATVPVRYETVDGAVLFSLELACSEGETVIEPQEAVLLGTEYTLADRTPCTVTVDSQGVATPSRVVFLCQIALPEATPAPVLVTVRYINEDGQAVASSQQVQCIAGSNPIVCNPQNLREGYVLASDEVQYVFVDQQGASQREVVFVYTIDYPVEATPAPSREPQAVLVPVEYVTVSGLSLASSNVICYTGENTVEADTTLVGEGYELEGSAVAQVVVDEEGSAFPSVVRFVFSADYLERSVVVNYRTEDGQNVASPQLVPCYVGSNLVACEPIDLRDYYELVSDPWASVTLLEDGTLQPDTVVFIYRAVATPTPAPSPLPYDVVPMDAYGYPTTDSINLRSVPSTASNATILRQVTRKDLAHVEGFVTSGAGEEWYLVTVADVRGFIRSDKVNLLSEQEVNTLLGYTPAPTPQATPTPSPIPDGAYIDRWGTVRASSGKTVNLRKKTSTSSGQAAKMNVGENLFVYDAVHDGNGVQWYRVLYKGKDGYVMAEYVTLMSEGESAAYQNSLASPMPVRTPQPTQTPVAVAVTPTPTATPVPVTPVPLSETPVPEETEPPFTQPPTADPYTVEDTEEPEWITPAPATVYRGYALTAQRADLRTGTRIDDVTVTTLGEETLVYVEGQTWVDGVCWSHVESILTQETGFVPDSSLWHISGDQAAAYLQQVQRQTATPQPTAEPEQYSGYAVANGDYVMMRSFADTNAQIVEVLSAGEAVWVLGQEYTPDAVWQIARYLGDVYGYIRADQLHMMSESESAEYELQLRTPTPVPETAITPAPVTEESPSSYGYVNRDNVRMRGGPGTGYEQIKLLKEYDFALVLGEEFDEQGTLWYRINQDGMEGCVREDYFTVLQVGELYSFLNSEAYIQSLNANVVTLAEENTITAVEDFNTGVWTNPNLTQATYAPFSQLLATATPLITAAPATATPTAVPIPTTFFSAQPTLRPNTDEGGGLGWVLGLGAVGIILGGGAYAYGIHRKNQRRAAQRAAQRRQQQTNAAQRAAYTDRAPAPGMESAAQAPGRQQAARRYGGERAADGTAVYARPAAAGTGTYPPERPAANGAAGDYAAYRAAGDTAAYRPVSSTTVVPPTGDTAAFRPVSSAAGTAPTGDTAAYRPVSNTTVVPPAGGTAAYRMANQGAAAQRTAARRTGAAPGYDDTAAYRSLAGSQAEPNPEGPKPASQDAPQSTARRRRADRYDSEERNV